MDPIQIWTMVGGTGLVSIVADRLVTHLLKARGSKVQERRREIDRADAAERDARILRESLAIHRRVIIDAPCLGPADLPPWPTTNHKTKE